MVNLDLLSKNAATLLPVGGVVDTVVVRLGRLLANKLLESGCTTAAQLLTYEQNEAVAHEECDLYLVELECDLINNIKSITALSALQSRLALVEDRLLTLLAQRARKELNTINEDPPLATRLAHEIEAIVSTSPLRGAQGSEFERLQATLLSASHSTCQTLLGKPHISWTDVMKADKPIPAADLLHWGSRLAQGVSLLSSVMQRLEGFFGKDPTEESNRGAPATYRQLYKFRQKPLHRVGQGKGPTGKLLRRRWEDESAQLIAERNFHAFAVCVDNVLTTMSEHLDVWDKYEMHRTAKLKPRLIEVENFFYVDGIRRSLHQLGETLEDALICADKLLDYCQENCVAAAELMDDEIWSLYPKINRENLKQARLKVRHSDRFFPLSVAHRDWISQLSEQALAPRV
ncbi:MAG: hypothetical protein RLZZ488_1639 [Pseudomonadota bacterium]